MNTNGNDNGNFNAPAELDRLQTLSLGVGIVGAVILIALGFLTGNVEGAMRSYLLGYIFWAGIAIGCLGLLLVQHLTGGSWGLVIRRILEAGAKTLPLVALLFAPILIFAADLYLWVLPTNDPIIEHKRPYLTLFWFGFRAIAYFGIWSAIAYWLTRWSRQQDETGEWTISNTMNKFSGPALIAFVLAVSFAAVDWVMSLDPHWFSSMYGLLFAIGWALSALAFVIALSAWLAGRAPMNRVLGAPHFHDLGKLLLAFVMVWAYFNLSQLLIIWTANIPEETPWYLRRMEGGWIYVGFTLILFHFAFPFVILLVRDVKRSARYLATMAVFILIMRLVDLFYLIAPNPTVAEHHGGHTENFVHLNLTDIVAPLAIGGIWLFYFVIQLKKRPLMPVNDPYFENAIAHGIEHH